MNLPNKLTLTRIILVPVFMIFVSLTGLDGIVDGTFNATFYLLAGIVFAASIVTLRNPAKRKRPQLIWRRSFRSFGFVVFS